MNQALLARQTTETSLRDTFGVVKRRKWLILLTMLVCMSIGGIVAVITPATYRSSALLLVEGRANSTSPNFAATDQLTSQFSLSAGTYDILTQIQLIQSFEVLSQAFSEARVVLPPPGSGVRAPEVRVTQVGQTNVLVVSVDADTRDVSQQLATFIPTVYLAYVRDKRDQEVTSALTFLDNKLKAEQTALTQAERALETFRRSRPVVAVDSDGVELTNRLSRAEASYRQTAAELAQAENNYRALVAQRKGVPDSIPTANTTTTFDLTEQTKSQIAELKARRANLLVDYQPDAPIVRQVDGEIREAEARLRDIPKVANRGGDQRNPVAVDLDSRIAQAKASVDGLRAANSQARAWEGDARNALTSFMQSQPRENELKRAVDTLTVQVGTTARQFSELSVRKNAVRDPVSVISQATIPQQVAPNIPLTLSLFFIIGVVVSVALASLREYTDDRVLTVQQAAGISNLPALGHVAAPTRALAQGGGAANLESYRTLVYNMLYSSGGEPVKSIMVVSSSPREGKSTVAFNIARVLANDSRKVVLVDANLRRPVLHRRLKLQDKPGLTEVIRGEVEVSEALQGTEHAGLYILSAGTVSEEASVLIGSAGMTRVEAALKENADYVIYDTPAVLTSADAQVLASLVDGTVYVAQLGLSRKGALRYALDLVRNAQARLLGIVYMNSKGAVETRPYDEIDEA